MLLFWHLTAWYHIAIVFAHELWLILWGKKDIAFRTKESKRLKETFADAEIHELDSFVHFVQGRNERRNIPYYREISDEV